MKKYKIIFKFWNYRNEFKDDYLDNNGKGFEWEDANHIASLLKPNATDIEIVEI